MAKLLISNNKKGPQNTSVAQVYGRNNTQPIVKTEHFQNDTRSKMSLFAGVFQKSRKKASEIRQVILALGLVVIATPAHATIASWYDCAKPGECSRHKITASGEKFDPNALTAAHKTLPFGTRVKVTYKGRSVVVRINDRGPFIRGRSIDLSRAAARQIGCAGVCRVSMTVVGKRRYRQ
jgi:rare lipoprotein A